MSFFVKFFSKKFFFAALLLVVCGNTLSGQISDLSLKQKFSEAVGFYKKGDYDKAEFILLGLKSEISSVDTVSIIGINNLLGIIRKNYGDYLSAEKYYTENLRLFKQNPDFPGKSQKLAKTYNNLANIFLLSGKYSKAAEYYEQALKIITESNLTEKEKKLKIEYIYFNAAIVYYNLKLYNKAIDYYLKSLQIKREYNLSRIGKVYFNLALAYKELRKKDSAELYFQKAISFGQDNPENQARVYKFYGQFLTDIKKYGKAVKYLRKAKNIYEKIYGFRHPYTANAYVYYGNYFSAVGRLDSALYWYQKSLIANTQHFKSFNININPSENDCFSKLQLLKSLKFKARALLEYGDKKRDTSFLFTAIKTSNQALQLIEDIRNEYVSADNKLIITGIEKECYSSAVEASFLMYEITNKIAYVYKTYEYVARGKASLLDDIFEKEYFFNAGVPENLKKLKKETERKTAAYEKMIYEENEKKKPDSVKILFLQSKVFKLHNTYDSLMRVLNEEYKKTDEMPRETVSVTDIQKKLPVNTSLVEYFISKHAGTSEQHLYIFIIDKYRFGFFKKNINGVFYDNIKAYTDRMSGITEINTLKSFNNFNKICCDLYLDLFKEVDETVKTENIIIVPDEEIAFISFDALQPEFKRQKIINYSAPDYLIYKYCFSYAYSSPLLFGRSKRKFDTFVYAFAPVYNDSINNPLRQNFGNLKQTQNEIKSVLGYFNGKAYTGSSALEDSLKTVFGKCGIIHIAGHASYEDTEREFSFLAFSDKPGISHEDGLLFAYEIESLNICSPMVVLSACNTGRGRLYSGEGVYSLARSFLTAGVLSVVYSLWNVNDNSAYEIMAKFYEYLSKGEMKNKALRAAKLNYLNTATPMAADPRYWSGYVISGDISPVVKPYGIKIVQIIAGIIFVFSVFVLLYALKSYDKNNKS